ncbi:MAG: 16S rRNA (uracil(1498)-N(3))-methyltransferase [Lentisphaeria bacterium]|nr:16S rRNA (uracil(1498)-N(3))-methyltransferase [Lentisphaeria bacterium]
MHRIYIPDGRFEAETVALNREESRQLRSVLRAEPGLPVELFNGRGETRSGQVTEVSKSQISVAAAQAVSHPRPGCGITLVQCLVKGKRMDWIVEKAVELGVGRIAPVISDRTIVRLNDKEAAARLERWERIVVEAARQCQTPWLPLFSPVQSLRSALTAVECEWKSVATLTAEHATPLGKRLTGRPASAAILIGPEGDLSSDEVAAALSEGWAPVSLGATVLRAETAALYAVSAMRCAWEDD